MLTNCVCKQHIIAIYISLFVILLDIVNVYMRISFKDGVAMNCNKRQAIFRIRLSVRYVGLVVGAAHVGIIISSCIVINSLYFTLLLPRLYNCSIMQLYAIICNEIFGGLIWLI